MSGRNIGNFQGHKNLQIFRKHIKFKYKNKEHKKQEKIQENIFSFSQSKTTIIRFIVISIFLGFFSLK